NRAEAATLDAEYDSRPWTRYIAVMGGHIHSGYWCAGGTIRRTTIRQWAPLLSGKTAGDAVAELGEALCTHCYPSAPVAWTAGRVTEQKPAPAPKPVDPKAITNPDGSPLRVAGGDVLKTEIAAQRRATADAGDFAFYGSDHPQAREWSATVTSCLTALAAKRGVDIETLRVELDAKIAKKAKREGWEIL